MESLNIETNHAFILFDTNIPLKYPYNNIGFFSDSTLKSENINSFKYDCDNTHYDDDIMWDAVKENWDAGNYHLTWFGGERNSGNFWRNGGEIIYKHKNNCQDWVGRVRDTYYQFDNFSTHKIEPFRIESDLKTGAGYVANYLY